MVAGGEGSELVQDIAFGRCGAALPKIARLTRYAIQENQLRLCVGKSSRDKAPRKVKTVLVAEVRTVRSVGAMEVYVNVPHRKRRNA